MTGTVVAEGVRAPVFDADGLIPAVVQESETGEVLMVAWMNAEALRRTLDTRETHFWSRSRRALWRKGETSGHTQRVEAVYVDCDSDTLLVRVRQAGVACHTGSRTCFFTRLDGEGTMLDPAPGVGGILDLVERMIQSRKVAPRPGSYVTGLLQGGRPAMARKVGEEATEVIVAALAESPARLVSEVADLWFHTLVLLGAHGLSLRHVLAELASRHRPDSTPAGDAREA